VRKRNPSLRSPTNCFRRAAIVGWRSTIRVELAPPTRGAWIETSSWGRGAWWYFSAAPHAGAWISTQTWIFDGKRVARCPNSGGLRTSPEPPTAHCHDRQSRRSGEPWSLPISAQWRSDRDSSHPGTTLGSWCGRRLFAVCRQPSLAPSPALAQR
jgi:hypothetical protein